MTHEAAYQLAIACFKAGRDGLPMPAVNDAQRKAAEDVYRSGQRVNA